jgi:hypothetical protein
LIIFIARLADEFRAVLQSNGQTRVGRLICVSASTIET